MWTQTLIATLATGLLPILIVAVGKFFFLTRAGGSNDRSRKIQNYVASFCAGALLNDVFVHLLDSDHDHGHGHSHAHHQPGRYFHLALLAGFATSFAFDLFPVHNCHSTSSANTKKHAHTHTHVSISTQLAGLLHCVTDGLTIAAAFMKSDQAGYATCHAMLLHEIPHRLRDLLVLQLSPLQLAAQLGCALVGAAAAIRLGERFSEAMELSLPFSAGGFVYLAAASMIPEVRDGPGKPIVKVACFIVGLLVV